MIPKAIRKTLKLISFILALAVVSVGYRLFGDRANDGGSGKRFSFDDLDATPASADIPPPLETYGDCGGDGDACGGGDGGSSY